MHEADHIVAELLTTGRDLWSGVECDIRQDRVVVYARLCATPNLERALQDSERLLANVLERRIGGQSWVAAVQWSERMCRTITPRFRAGGAP
jgi:hypothetical protein